MTRTRLILLTVIIASLVAGRSMAAPPVEEHRVDAGNYHLFFKVIRGEGPVILLEAGGGGDSSEWDALAPRLAAATGATVVSYDRPGFGRSDLPDIPCDMREESQSLWRALAALELDRQVILVGLSYGGWVVRLHANDHPERVAGLVFIDPFNCTFVESLGLDYCDRHPMMGNLPFKNDDPATLTRQQKALVRMVGDGLGPKIEIMRDTKIPEGIPVRWIMSGQAFLTKEHEQNAWTAAQKENAEAIPGAVLIVAEQSGHFVTQDQPDLVIETIADIAAEVR
jgi:pimeloyl-ACP methyl ester carboxylesterase